MSDKPLKIYITFDNFTHLSDDAEKWMEPEEYAALPTLHPNLKDIWENYKAARAAHNAACSAVLFHLRYPAGAPQSEVERQQQVFEKIYSAYCDWSNSKELEDPDTHYMEKIRELIRPELQLK